MKIDSCRESPCNLYQICKNFIAKNLHLVESLVDFPDVIGNDLFVEALQIQVFHKKPKYLNIFCVAYRSLVLKHLALRHSTVMINENLKFLQCFNSLTKLDLGHCRLGDSHEYLQWIGKMKRYWRWWLLFLFKNVQLGIRILGTLQCDRLPYLQGSHI